jgi:nicotinate-nucleotide adenylyltransferase
MNIGIFGGTFDPIHSGHLALARAARQACSLGKIYFVPAGTPPHKTQPAASFFDRFAMVALATAGEKTFVPSGIEAPALVEKSPGKKTAAPNYSIETVRRLRARSKKNDKLFFLIGIDAFNDIADWHKAEELFAECEFIVASRPGYSLADVAKALPKKLHPEDQVTEPFAKQPARGSLVLRGATIHLLEDVHSPISATHIREAVVGKTPLKKFLPAQVEEYVKKMGLYGSLQRH